MLPYIFQNLCKYCDSLAGGQLGTGWSDRMAWKAGIGQTDPQFLAVNLAKIPLLRTSHSPSNRSHRGLLLHLSLSSNISISNALQYQAALYSSSTSRQTTPHFVPNQNFPSSSTLQQIYHSNQFSRARPCSFLRASFNLPSTIGIVIIPDY